MDSENPKYEIRMFETAAVSNFGHSNFEFIN